MLVMSVMVSSNLGGGGGVLGPPWSPASPTDRSKSSLNSSSSAGDDGCGTRSGAPPAAVGSKVIQPNPSKATSAHW